MSDALMSVADLELEFEECLVQDWNHQVLEMSFSQVERLVSELLSLPRWSDFYANLLGYRAHCLVLRLQSGSTPWDLVFTEQPWTPPLLPQAEDLLILLWNLAGKAVGREVPWSAALFMAECAGFHFVDARHFLVRLVATRVVSLRSPA